MAKRRNKKQPTLASQADRHDLYQKAVQATEFEIEFYEQCYREIRGKRKKPVSLREDFCGTGLLSVDWCKSNNKRTAVGVDLCSDTLKWGLENNIKKENEKLQKRITLLNDNVLDVTTTKMDVICAMNFSYCVFESRETLKTYFINVLRSIKKDGLFFMDLMGGTSTIDVSEEFRFIDDDQVMYIWEHESFNPVDNHIVCHIHFEFDDGSKLNKAFTYVWRLWTLPELKDLLLEAGFSSVHIYWEEFVESKNPKDEYLEGTGTYREVTEMDQQESWLAYIVAAV